MVLRHAMNRLSTKNIWNRSKLFVEPSPTFSDLRRVQNQDLSFDRDARSRRWRHGCPRSAPVPPVDFERYRCRGCHYGRAPGRSSFRRRFGEGRRRSAKVGTKTSQTSVSEPPGGHCMVPGDSHTRLPALYALPVEKIVFDGQ